MLAPLLAAAALVVPGFSVARPLEPLALHSRPGGPVVAHIGRWTSFGSPQVLGVGAAHGDWLGVISPALPNGRLGWVRGRWVRVGAVRTSISVDLSARRLVLRRGHAVVRRFTVAVGKAGSTTPTGRFSVTDKLPGSRIYGCCVLALSGHQPHPPAGWVGGH